MQDLSREALLAARYPRDRELLDHLKADKKVGEAMGKLEILRNRSSIRARLLSRAVRVSTNTVPSVALSLQRLRAVYGEAPIEAYVFSNPEIQAFVSEGRTHPVVGFSSGAIEKLTAQELEFVLGHELGHVMYAHFELPTDRVIDMVGKEELIRAWERAAELSADRAGLLCVGELQVALTALIKTVSGLNIGPQWAGIEDMLAQWDMFAEELTQEGSRETTLSHPYPLLRLRALALFATHGNTEPCNAEVRRMMSFMEEGAVAQVKGSVDAAAPSQGTVPHVDPYLTTFVFWGSLHVAGPHAVREELAAGLRQLKPPGLDANVVLSDARTYASNALAKLKEAKATRREKLSAQDVFGLLSSVIGLSAGHAHEADYRTRLSEVAAVFGIQASGVDSLMTQLEREKSNVHGKS